MARLTAANDIKPVALEQEKRVSSDETHHGAVVDEQGEFQIIDCERCHFVHALPLPDPADLQAYYQSSYYVEEKPEYVARAKEDAEWAALTYTDKLVQFETILGSSRRHLLDIGCGPGYFLKTAQERGWLVCGIEPSQTAAAHAKSLGLAILEQPLTPDLIPAVGEMDVVTMTNVIEHVPNPADFIDWANQMIRPGGLLCVTVPNDYNPLQRTLRDSGQTPAWWLAAPHHLNYFNFESLEYLVSLFGFEPVIRTTSFPMEMFALLGDNYITEPDRGRACHEKRKAFDQAFEKAGNAHLRRLFYDSLAQGGFGREATVIAQKP